MPVPKPLVAPIFFLALSIFAAARAIADSSLPLRPRHLARHTKDDAATSPDAGRRHRAPRVHPRSSRARSPRRRRRDLGHPPRAPPRPSTARATSALTTSVKYFVINILCQMI
jgi:hypothetical protein